MSDKTKKKTAKSAGNTRKPSRAKTKEELSDADLSKASGGTIFRANMNTEDAVIVKKHVSCFPYCQDDGR